MIGLLICSQSVEVLLVRGLGIHLNISKIIPELNIKSVKTNEK